MNKQELLDKLTEARSRLSTVRDVVEAEIRKIRDERLSAYRRDLRYLILAAYAAGASMGEIKRAYGTKDHRTISDVINEGAAEIEAMRQSAAEIKAREDWYELTDNGVLIRDGGEEVFFTIAEMEEDEILLQAETPRWNEDWTVENKVVGKYDGMTSDELPEVEVIRKAWLEARG